MKSPLFRLGIALLATLCAGFFPSSTVTRNPYIQNVTKKSAVIIWKSADSYRGKIAVEKSDGWHTYTARTQSSDHVVSVTGLTPGKKHRYRVMAADGSVLKRSHFYTSAAASDSGTVRIAIFGDSGQGTTAQNDVASAIAAWNPKLLIHTGDIVYNNGEPELYDARFFTPYQSILKRAPLFPAPGNHDVRTPEGYLDAFNLPAVRSGSNSERYYSFDYGNAHFIILDSNESFAAGATQRSWLEQDLADVSQSAWKIAVFHHPPFSNGSHGPNTTLQETLVPLLEDHKIDLVLNGHDHAYERTDPVSLNGSHAIRYIVTGGGGASLYSQVYTDTRIAVYEAVYHYVQLRLSKDALSLRAVNTAGSVIDSLHMNKD